MHRRTAWSTRTLSWLILGELSSKRRFAVVDAVPTPTPTPLLNAIRARAEICVLRTTLSAEMVCAVRRVRGKCEMLGPRWIACSVLSLICMRIDLVLSAPLYRSYSELLR